MSTLLESPVSRRAVLRGGGALIVSFSLAPHLLAQERLPGALASRITATSNAAFTLLNTGSWNVLPPCVAVTFAILFIGSVAPPMAAALAACAFALGALVFWLARQIGRAHV